LRPLLAGASGVYRRAPKSRGLRVARLSPRFASHENAEATMTFAFTRIDNPNRKTIVLCL